MKAIALIFGALACLVPAAVGHAQVNEASVSLDDLNSLIAGAAPPAGAQPSLTLGAAERIALQENPEIRLAIRQVQMAESHVPGAGSLDDPQLMYRGWGVPLTQPWNYNAAQNMIMVGQMLPGPGKRPLRTSIAQSDVPVAKAQLEAVRLRIRVQTEQAFYDMLRAQEESRIHDQHVGIARQAIQAAKIKYTVGKVPQMDILKAQLAMTRLAEHMVRFEQDLSVARARLNTLMGRDPDAPLEVAEENEVTLRLPSVEVLESLAFEHRPELMQAQAEVEKSRNEQNLAKKTNVPDFNVAAGYMLMPSGSDVRNNYMVEGSITLPWLNRRKHDAELAEAAAGLTEKSAELDALRNTVRGQIGVALVQAQSADRLARFYQNALRKQAEETLHAAVIAYENDQTSFLDLLDSQMAVVDIDLAAIDAVAEFNNRMADLEMAAGTTLRHPQGEELRGEEENK